MTGRILGGFALLLAVGGAAPPQIAWQDPSSHGTSFVTVADGVRLEALDWGGSGPAIILLAGLGDTGHVFDTFAPQLVGRGFRVIALTRRGHGRSSAPPTGYGFARLAEDVASAIDALGVTDPFVVGHSFAGEEMHALGSRYSDRIAGLVYLDAAFDRGDDSDDDIYAAAVGALPSAPNPTPDDKASYAALRGFLERTQGTLFPEAHLRARYVANPDGTVGGMWAPDRPVRLEMMGAMRDAYADYAPETIGVPALAIYAAPRSAPDLMRPWYPIDDPTIGARVDELYRLQRDRVERHGDWFQRLVQRGRVAEIAGAHHLFVSNPKEVIDEIGIFTATLGGDADG